MPNIESNKRLPPELCIQSIDDILYSIGLCHHSVRDRPKRSVINKPIIILIVLLLQIPMRTISNYTDDETILLLTADSGHYINRAIKEYINIMSILLSLIPLFSQMFYFYNYRIGVKPTFVHILQVLSGSITPSSVGLNPTQIKRLLKIAKWLPKLRKNNKIMIPFSSFACVFGLHIYSLSFLSSIIRCIYPVIFQCLWTYYAVNILSIQIFLLFILCKYFLIKFEELTQLLTKEKRMNSNRIRNILNESNTLFDLINEYNSTYWSKFLLDIWFLLGLFNVFLIYVLIFITIPIITRISLIYFFILYSNVFLFILTITSSVNLKANKFFKLFNSYKIKFTQTSKLDKRRMTINQIKVILLNNFINPS